MIICLRTKVSCREIRGDTRSCLVIETAGILLYRRLSQDPQVLLVHFGGPFWANKDKYAWSIPRGVIHRGEEPLAAAKRELLEELGTPVVGKPELLGRYYQNGRKNLSVW